MFYRVTYCYPKEMYLSSNIFEIENQSIKQTCSAMMQRGVASGSRTLHIWAQILLNAQAVPHVLV